MACFLFLKVGVIFLILVLSELAEGQCSRLSQRSSEQIVVGKYKPWG